MKSHKEAVIKQVGIVNENWIKIEELDSVENHYDKALYQKCLEYENENRTLK